FIVLCERQQVRRQVQTGDQRAASGQLAGDPTLPAGQITNDCPLDRSDQRQEVRQDHFRVDRSVAQILVIPPGDIIVRRFCHIPPLFDTDGLSVFLYSIVPYSIVPCPLTRACDSEGTHLIGRRCLVAHPVGSCTCWVERLTDEDGLEGGEQRHA